MADLGKVVVTDGGDYTPSTTYEKLTFVHYGSNTYMTLKTVMGITPTDDGVNYKLFCRSAELATNTAPGTMMPDGITTEVAENGSLSVKTATQTTPGVMKGSAGIKVGEDGAADISTVFIQAAELANIIAGEAIALVLGKISKSIAVTMGLNENALLKNMLTNMDVNDSGKINSAAFVHTLVERIGMGTELTAGANLTAGLNALNSNLTALTTGDTLLGKIKYLPGNYIDNPNGYFNISSWNVVPYLTFYNVAPDIGWGLVVGILDNNNGNPVGSQFTVGTVQMAYRKYVSGAWSAWLPK